MSGSGEITAQRDGITRLLSDSLVLDATEADRLCVTRLRVGDRVELPFSPWMRTTRCVTQAPDVRALWDLLLAREANAVGGCLRGGPATILDVAGASVSKLDPSRLQVTVGRGATGSPDVLAVPRFTYAVAPRKLRNFAHWLLDCVPQAAVLATVVPRARVLLPLPLNDVQRSTLSLAGVADDLIVPWDGSEVNAGRCLVFESDGRAGGGRPFSPLLHFRRAVAEAAVPAGRGARRIYVSRRDAKAKRQWATNEAEIEAVFASRGFEIVCPTAYGFADLVGMFREAAIVAGLNGAGLAHIFFSPPGTHVIVLVTDSLVRWHADGAGARSLWAGPHHADAGELAPLGDSPRFYAHVAAAFEQPYHSFLSGDDVPPGPLGDFLDEALGAAEGG